MRVRGNAVLVTYANSSHLPTTNHQPPCALKNSRRRGPPPLGCVPSRFGTSASTNSPNAAALAASPTLSTPVGGKLAPQRAKLYRREHAGSTGSGNGGLRASAHLLTDTKRPSSGCKVRLVAESLGGLEATTSRSSLSRVCICRVGRRVV